MALLANAAPQDVFDEIVRQGYDTDTVAVIAGGLLGARFGTSWIPTDRLIDCDRLKKYAQTLVNGVNPPESQEAFLRHEATLTRSEIAFQAQVVHDWGSKRRGTRTW